MGQQSSLDHESSAVQKHIEIVHGVIQRMAENSRSCKVWCVTLVAATLVLVARTDEPEYALIALIPVVLFLILDTYYLALERAFRQSYNDFVQNLHEDSLRSADLYQVVPSGLIPRYFITSLRSFSICPFYFVLAAMILFIWWVISQ